MNVLDNKSAAEPVQHAQRTKSAVVGPTISVWVKSYQGSLKKDGNTRHHDTRALCTSRGLTPPLSRLRSF